MHQTSPALDHTLERLQRASGNDRRRDHHSAGQAAFQRQVGAPAEDRDLSGQAQEPRKAADPETAIEGGDLHRQRAGLVAPPLQHALIEHSHSIDDLRIARQRLRLRVGHRSQPSGLHERRRCRSLVQQGNGHESDPSSENDHAELAMDEKDGGEVERRHRRIEQDQHRRAGDEAAHLMQAAQRLHATAVADGRRRDDARQYGSAEDGLHSRRQPAEHLAAQCIQQRKHDDQPQRQADDSMTSVSMLRLVRTRSEIWNR